MSKQSPLSQPTQKEFPMLSIDDWAAIKHYIDEKFHELQIKQGHNFEADAKDYAAAKVAEKVTNPSEGAVRFYVIEDRTKTFTAIGADNIHHATNKATKLFRQQWSEVVVYDPSKQYMNRNCASGYNFRCVKDFAELLRLLP